MAPAERSAATTGASAAGWKSASPVSRRCGIVAGVDAVFDGNRKAEQRPRLRTREAFDIARPRRLEHLPRFEGNERVQSARRMTLCEQRLGVAFRSQGACDMWATASTALRLQRSDRAAGAAGAAGAAARSTFAISAAVEAVAHMSQGSLTSERYAEALLAKVSFGARFERVHTFEPRKCSRRRGARYRTPRGCESRGLCSASDSRQRQRHTATIHQRRDTGLAEFPPGGGWRR